MKNKGKQKEIKKNIKNKRTYETERKMRTRNKNFFSKNFSSFKNTKNKQK